MTQNIKYLVRDPSGDIFGPADESLLRRWTLEGRIIPGMFIAPQQTQDWVDAAVHPAVADLLTRRMTDGTVFLQPGGSSPTSTPLEIGTGGGGQELTYSKPPRLNRPALFAFICGTLGLLSLPPSACCCVTIFLGPIGALADVAGVGLGIWALWQMKLEPARYLGRGLAIMGIVLGCLALVVWAVLIACVIVSGTLHR